MVQKCLDDELAIRRRVTCLGSTALPLEDLSVFPFISATATGPTVGQLAMVWAASCDRIFGVHVVLGTHRRLGHADIMHGHNSCAQRVWHMESSAEAPEVSPCAVCKGRPLASLQGPLAWGLHDRPMQSWTMKQHRHHHCHRVPALQPPA